METQVTAMQHTPLKYRRGPKKGIIITDRDIRIIKSLKYGGKTLKQVYTEAWTKYPEYKIGGNKTIVPEGEKGSFKRFKNRITDLVNYEYLNKIIMPTYGLNSERIVIAVGDAGEKLLYSQGENIVRCHPVKSTEMGHDMMVTDALRRFDRDVKRKEKEGYVYSYNFDYEYNLRKINADKKNAVFPDFFVRLSFLQQNITTKEEKVINRIIYCEVDNCSTSISNLVDYKIAALAGSPLYSDCEDYDRHIVYIIVNETGRSKALLKRIRSRKNRILNWENIGIGMSSEVSKYGYFGSIFRNCNGESVDIMMKREVKNDI